MRTLLDTSVHEGFFPMGHQTKIKKKVLPTKIDWIRVKSLLMSELLWITVFRCDSALPLQPSKHAKVTSR